MKKLNRKLLKRDDEMVEQGLAQWWEHSPPTKVARVQIPASKPYVGWVYCWFSLAPRDFSNVSFSLSSKTNTCKFQFDQVDEEPASGSATSKSLFIIYSLFKWKWVLFSLYRHPTQMIANQYHVILKIPLLKIRPNWQKQSSWLFTSVTDELNSVLLIKKHLQLVVIVRLKPETPRLEVWRADTQTSCLVKRMSVYSLCQVYKFFSSPFNHEIFSLRWLSDSILEHASDHMF